MKNHTPGPWTIQETCREYNGDLMIVAMEAGDNGTHVCQVTTSTRRNKINITKEQDANAQLIASAPDLLEAAKEYLKRTESMVMACDEKEAQRKLRDAIKKSEGAF